VGASDIPSPVVFKYTLSVPFALLYLTDTESSEYYPENLAMFTDVSDNPASTKGTEDDTPPIPEGPRATYGVTRVSLYLGGVVGVPDQHAYAPDKYNFTFSPFRSAPISSSAEDFMWPFEQATHERSPIRFPVPAEVTIGFQQRGWGDLTTHAVILSLSSEVDSTPLGFLIMGVNTRRNYDADYSNWMHLLKSALSSYLAGSISREEEVKRSKCA
jgi:hypothetical protein